MMESLKDILARQKLKSKGKPELEAEPLPCDKEFEETRYYMAHPAEYIYKRIFDNLYSLYKDCSLSDFGADGVKVEKWLEAGNGLFIWGPVGVGKTHMALSCLKWQLKRGGLGFIWSIDEMLDKLRHWVGMKDNQALELQINGYAAQPLLAIDDLSVQAATQWADEKLYEIINRRWLRKGELITIVTSNYAPEDLEAKIRDEIVGARIMSRIIGMCKTLELKGEDRRMVKRASDRPNVAKFGHVSNAKGNWGGD